MILEYYDLLSLRILALSHEFLLIDATKIQRYSDFLLMSLIWCLFLLCLSLITKWFLLLMYSFALDDRSHRLPIRANSIGFFYLGSKRLLSMTSTLIVSKNVINILFC